MLPAANRAAGVPAPRRVALVLGTTAGGTGAHVKMLAGSLARRGVAVDVLGPPATDADFGFSAVEGAVFRPVAFGDRPRPRDVAALLRLRRLLTARGGPPEVAREETPEVAHAHGMRAGALAVIALTGKRRPRLVVTVHNAPPAGGGAARLIYLVLERIVARGAGLVLCVSGDLEQRMREAGARRVGRAVIAAPEGIRPAAARAADVAAPRPRRGSACCCGPPRAGGTWTPGRGS